MKLHKLYHTLVLGGGALVAGCAGSQSSATAQATGPAEGSAAPATKTADEALGANESGGDEPAKIPLMNPKLEEARCGECEGPRDRGMMCPDPQVGEMNCCWLMSSPRHPCCP